MPAQVQPRSRDQDRLPAFREPASHLGPEFGGVGSGRQGQDPVAQMGHPAPLGLVRLARADGQAGQGLVGVAIHHGSPHAAGHGHRQGGFAGCGGTEDGDGHGSKDQLRTTVAAGGTSSPGWAHPRGMRSLCLLCLSVSARPSWPGQAPLCPSLGGTRPSWPGSWNSPTEGQARPWHTYRVPAEGASAVVEVVGELTAEELRAGEVQRVPGLVPGWTLRRFMRRPRRACARWPPARPFRRGGTPGHRLSAHRPGGIRGFPLQQPRQQQRGLVAGQEGRLQGVVGGLLGALAGREQGLQLAAQPGGLAVGIRQVALRPRPRR